MTEQTPTSVAVPSHPSARYNSPLPALVADFVVLGGGLAGLTFADEATKRGRSAIVLERDEQVGGLSRTMTYGDYRFDLGGHRFYTAMTHINAWVDDLLGDDMIEVGRRSRIRLQNRYVDYPIEFPGAISAFPLPTAARIIGSYIGATIARMSPKPDISFEDWVTQRFGRALYDIYFKPYTEKVWGMDCTLLSADWASQRIKLPSLMAAVTGSLKRSGKPKAATLVSRFTYPVLGIGMMTDKLAERATATGRGFVRVNSAIERLEHDASAGLWRVHYRHKGEACIAEGRQVISTIPLDRMIPMLPATPAETLAASRRLDYRSLMCVFLAIDGQRVSEDTWTYFPDRSLTLGRTHEPRNWSPRMAPEGNTSLCVEIFCQADDHVWQTDDATLITTVTDELDKLGFLARTRVHDAWMTRVHDAYPVYRIGYKEVLDQLHDHLRGYPTLHLVGRTGSFSYLNIDAVIDQALKTASELAKQ
ncbi:MAG: NAD(P)-binding protein [Anaerolineales bacterium]|jgi:protoporphyrinogen oxidase|nr:NAD(P)-binding protein [Anaerolineales bacterium]